MCLVPAFNHTNAKKKIDVTLGNICANQMFFNLLKFCSQELMFKTQENKKKTKYKNKKSKIMIGNLEFQESAGGHGELKGGADILTVVSNLLGLNAADIKERLETRTVKVGMESIKAKLNLSDAWDNSSALAKTIYHRLFLWAVNRMSNTLLPKKSNDIIESMLFIGILDVFGFECFENNSFEQFAINYANEVLQQHFNESVIASEQQEYLREGLPWTELTIPDNGEMVDLISAKGKGIFTLLDSACSMPKGSPGIFHDSVMKTHKKHKLLKNSKRKDSPGFVVTHYAAIVDYQVDQFLGKNTDTVHNDTILLLTKSKFTVIKDMMKDDLAEVKFTLFFWSFLFLKKYIFVRLTFTFFSMFCTCFGVCVCV